MTTDPRDMFFRRMSQPGGADGRRQDGFEAIAVKQILRGVGLAPSKWAILEQECRALGHTHLNFEWLSNRYPGCPVHFGAAKVENTHRVTIDDLFNRFTKTAIFNAYKEFLISQDLDDEEQQVGFIFNWKSSRHTMALHNLCRDGGIRPVPGTRIVHPHGDPPVTYVIEPVSKLIMAIKDEWDPVSG